MNAEQETQLIKLLNDFGKEHNIYLNDYLNENSPFDNEWEISLKFIKLD